ncbi:MAG: 4-hydroxythreonine-4-phosphate dehydrogenase, partial [Streptomyces sp.]|nr:4-hydroxythreonine-4-phosphate dehydrogenase [Streptomyces sp.]
MLAVADDLSGAAETAAGLESRTTRSRVVLVGSSAAPRHPGEATVLDLDSRHLPAAAAAEAVRAALALPPPGDTLVLKKIDSLLRGNVAAEVAALAADGASVVVAPALPAAGRAV